MTSTTALFAAIVMLSGAALAQTGPTGASANDAITQKFISLDADKSGFLDGKEVDAFKAQMTFLDMDKDGKVSPSEYNVGVMTGVIAK